MKDQSDEHRVAQILMRYAGRCIVRPDGARQLETRQSTLGRVAARPVDRAL